MNESIAEGLSTKKGFEWAAWDSYRRFLQMWGMFHDLDRNFFDKIINDFKGKGLDCVILACTDLQLLIPTHPKIKIFDTMKIFADATVRKILV